eukprot:COSAG02_NODE_56100_length_287_cov_0.808511_2_plen_32_part_01
MRDGHQMNACALACGSPRGPPESTEWGMLECI